MSESIDSPAFDNTGPVKATRPSLAMREDDARKTPRVTVGNANMLLSEEEYLRRMKAYQERAGKGLPLFQDKSP